jgi:CRP/FNR family transcriptional regulator
MSFTEVVREHNRRMSAPGLARDGVDFLSLLSEANRRRVLEGSTRTVFRAGSIAFHPEGPPVLFLLESGLARAYSSVPDGRQATVAFAHENELIGGIVILSRPPMLYVQAVVESTLRTLDVETVRKLAASEIDVLNAIASHLTARVFRAFQLIGVRSLGNIRERVAYDLLERACRSQLMVGRLEARATHANIADSIGSSREVVSRALRDLRVARIVETAPGMVRVIDPIRLAAIVRAFVI